MADDEPMPETACGDHALHSFAEPELSPELRDALTLLRDRSDDDEFRALVDDVLAGRCGLIEAAGTAAFGAAVFAPIAQDVAQRFPGRTGLDSMAPDGQQRGACPKQEATAHGEAWCGPCGGCSGVCAAFTSKPPS